ncbi:4-(cytidine 5'-diphospho)-2-C-methyl-D-erythritol kinase [bacterium]|nr:MAG: 4-(cytidine 5'-diphospho)-2-C-methyl-D-erythritol kinase [bacterium]
MSYIICMKSVTIHTPAKVNLFLEILGERSDGFTEIRSLMQAVSLYDEVRIEKADKGLVLSASETSIPLDYNNSAAKAWGVFCRVVGSELGAKIHIGKRIPPESGLGGGSSDAAATLAGLSKVYDIKLDTETLMKIGAAVGSDVPFFFGSGTSLVEGRGEKITDIDIEMDYALLLIKPRYGMRTAEAYSLARKTLTDVEPKVKIENYDFNRRIIDLCDIGNALEPVFLSKFPESKNIKDRLLETGASYAALSGSGSAFFGLFEDINTAKTGQKQFPDLWTAVVKPVGIDYF